MHQRFTHILEQLPENFHITVFDKEIRPDVLTFLLGGVEPDDTACVAYSYGVVVFMRCVFQLISAISWNKGGLPPEDSPWMK